jgi:hypothetical protein
MIDELRILQEILGDLSGVGLNIVLAYIAFRVFIILAWCWFGYYLSNKAFSFFTFKREEVIEDFKSQWNRERKDLESKYDREIADKDMQVEKVKHMYKILKEKKECEDV